MGLIPKDPSPLSLRVETLAVATIDLVRDYNRHRMEHLAPTTQQKIDQFSDYVGQKYLGVLKTSGAPIDPSAATTKLGRELFYWVIPLEEGKVASKLTTEELTHQVEKKAVPKTAPSATKAETSGAKTAKEIRKPEEVYAPDRKLPQTEDGVPIPDTDVAHTQLGTKISKRTGKKYTQAREFDKEGRPMKDIHFTDHGRSQNHPNPHQHAFNENLTGGTLTRGDPEQVSTWSYE